MGLLVGKALPHQYRFIYSRAKFPALVSGLGAGKTEALIYRTLKFLTEIKGAKIGIYEPTVDLIKRILYPRFEDIFATSGIKFKLNKSDGVMQVWMPNTGLCEIIFRSMENPARIIGYETHHSLLDEIDTIATDKATDVWGRVIARNRKKFYVYDPQNPKQRKKGVNTIGITTTPEGFKFVYKTWAKKHLNDPNYELIKGRTRDNHHLPDDYIPAMREFYPPQLIDAYLNGKFVNMKGRTVYSGFDRHKNYTSATLDDYPESTPLLIGMDFNVGRMGAVVGVKTSDPEAGIRQLRIVDEFFKLEDTPAMIAAIRSRYPNRTIVVYPDASGRSRKSVDASKSDIALLRQAGFRINAPKKNPPVRERVVSTNTMFLNSDNVRNLLVNTDKCPNLTEAVEKQIYDDNGIPVKDGDEDINDALGYLTNRVFGLARPTTVIGRMRVA